MNQKPLLIVILDGFGHSYETIGNALTPSTIPYIWHLYTTNHSSLIPASGKAVGLPDGVVGNSEAGHLTIGTGSIIEQPLTTINHMIEQKTLPENSSLKTLYQTCKKAGKSLHIMGLASNGNTHGTINHLIGYINTAKTYGIESIVVHPFLDGRDTLPQVAETFLNQLEQTNVIIGSIHGRFYAMDRDNNLDRTSATYTVLTDKTQPINHHHWKEVLTNSYQQGLSDEYIVPTLLTKQGIINEGDFVIHANIRPERSVQLLSLLSSSMHLTIVSAISYPQFPMIQSILPQPHIVPGIKSIVVSKNRPIITIAETEKWAHVTYFFDGYRHDPFPLETRIQIPSIKMASYIDNPSMQAARITATALDQLKLNHHGFFLINYANIDMVGHTGDIAATTKAAQHIDAQIKALHEAFVIKNQGTMIIVGDHGNGETLLDATTKTPTGAHTTNPVPCIVINNTGKTMPPIHQLTDIKPVVQHVIV